MRFSSPRAAFVLAAGGLAGIFALVPLACSDDPSRAPADASAEASDSGGDAAVDDAAAPVVPRGARVLGLAVDVTDLEFPANVDVARDAGAQTTTITFAWDEIERPFDAGAPDPDAGDGGDAGEDGGAPTTRLFDPALHVVNLVLGDRRMQATLSIEAFDVGGSRAPADLSSLALDDPSLLARYDALLDYVFDQIRDTELTALLVASGADALVERQPAAGAALAAFVAHASAHAKVLRPGVKVGFAAGTRASATTSLLPAWKSADFVAYDYLAIDPASATTKPSDAPAADFAALGAEVAALGKPVLLRQAGYPSSPACGGTEETQAAFVASAFRAWDRGAPPFLAIVFRELDDATPGQGAAIAARYGRSDPAFVAAQTSLGMRGSAGREKPALGALRRESHVRGW